MKKLGLLLASLFLITGFTFAKPLSILSLELADRSEFIVVFDGQVINHPDYSVKIKDIRPGDHYLKVIKVRRHQQDRVVFKGKVFIPRSTRIKAVIDHGRFIELKRVPIQNHKGQAISKREMERLVFDLMDTRSEHKKLRKAENVIQHKRVKARQVAKIMKYLQHEDDRLHLAKFAYRYTIDKENYYMVERSLRFKESKKKFRRFLRNKY